MKISMSFSDAQGVRHDVTGEESVMMHINNQLTRAGLVSMAVYNLLRCVAGEEEVSSFTIRSRLQGVLSDALVKRLDQLREAMSRQSQ